MDPWSSLAVYVEATYFGKGTSATAILWETQGRDFLVSNWHVFSGRHSRSNKKLTGNTPEHLSVRFPTIAGWDKTEVDLVKNGKPLWYQHPSGSQIDVAVLPISLPDSFARALVNTSVSWDGDGVDVGYEVFVLGYPRSQAANHYPIWKRGTLATEPTVDIGDEPKLYIDAATATGMSGGPVVARKRPAFLDSRGNRIISCGSATAFIGLYSGRYDVAVPSPQDAQDDDEIFKAHIGIVWKRRCIEETIEALCPGQVETPEHTDQF